MGSKFISAAATSSIFGLSPVASLSLYIRETNNNTNVIHIFPFFYGCRETKMRLHMFLKAINVI